MVERFCIRRAIRRLEKGFTLVELLVVLVILGLLAAIVAPSVIGYLSSARSETAKIQIENLAASVELYVLDVGRYPTADEGLRALIERPASADRWNGPYLKKDELPLDPWGQDYIYRRDDSAQGFTILSLGADNAEGGEGENADISN